MPAGPFLVGKYNARNSLMVQEAFRLVEQDFDTDPTIPEDTGRLRDGNRLINRFVSAPRYSGIAVSTARSSDGGANYPAILEAAPRIAPRRAKFLRFVVGGQVVFSKGFDNKHYQWWSKFWGQNPSPWREALITSLAKTPYGGRSR